MLPPSFLPAVPLPACLPPIHANQTWLVKLPHTWTLGFVGGAHSAGFREHLCIVIGG